MQKKHYLGLTKMKLLPGLLVWAIQLIVGIMWLVETWSSPSDNSMRSYIAIVMISLAVVFFGLTILGYTPNRYATKLLINEGDFWFKPMMNSKLIKIKWKDIRYLKVNHDKLQLQLANHDKLITYKTSGVFSSAAIQDLREKAKEENIEFVT